MRDKLIQLILECSTYTPEYEKQARHHAEYLAQHLLNEGVIIAPCKVGDRIYYIDSTNFIDCEVVKQISINYHGKWAVLLDHSLINFDEIGKTVFLTREEAEAALERSENEQRKAD